MVIFRILDRYLVKRITVTFLFTLISLLAFSFIIRLTEELGSVGKGQYDLVAAIGYTFLMSFGEIENYFPMAGLLGAMVALGQLASTSELIIIQSVGVSRFRILLGLLWFIVPVSLANIAVQEWVTPFTNNYAVNYKAEKINNGNFYISNSRVWEKSANEFIYSSVISTNELGDVIVINFNQDQTSVDNLIIGKKALGNPQGHSWIIDQAVVYSLKGTPEYADASIDLENLATDDLALRQQQTEILNQRLEEQLQQLSDNNQAPISPWISTVLSEGLLSPKDNEFNVQLYKNYNWVTSLTPDKLQLVNRDINGYAISTLGKYINILNNSNQNSLEYQYLFGSRIFAGISFFVMVGIAIASVFGSVRNTSMLMKVFSSIIIGLIFYILNSTIGPFIMNLNVAPGLAALMPSILFSGYFTYLYTRK